jgi:hypothetical protein
MTEQEKFNERQSLIDDCLALKETPRLVNATRVSSFPFFKYGVTIKEASTDYDKAIDAYVRYHREFQPDIGASISAYYSFKAFDAMGIKNMRYAGDKKGLDENSPYQYIEFPTMQEDEYDEYFNDPTGFAVRKWLPSMYEVFEPLAKLPFASMVTDMYQESLAVFTSPPIVETYKRLIAASEAMQEFNEAGRRCTRIIQEMGFPVLVGGASATAFDMLGNGLRGTFGIMPDLMTQPEQVERALEKFVEYHIGLSKRMFKLTGNKFQWVMLHKGFDNFIGDKEYARFYWPYLRKWAMALIDEGIVPVLFCEEKYNTRLKYLTELPKGKALLVFERTDLELAKKIVGGNACIVGGMPIYTLTNGTREQVVDTVKNCIDTLAPGGGYMISASCAIDNCKSENLEAMYETIELYGKK